MNEFKNFIDDKSMKLSYINVLSVSICDIGKITFRLTMAKYLPMSQNGTIANRRFLLVTVRNPEMPIVLHNWTKQNESE
jgi:hypothetical protein